MSEETEKKPEEEKKAEPEEVEEKEKHSNTDNISESNKAIVDVLAKVAETLSKNTELIGKIEGKIDKALEEPTNLAAKPAVSAEDDIGDKVKVPDTYQSNSQQASIDDSDPKNDNEKDPGDLKMQEKQEVKKTTVSKANLEKTSIERPIGAVVESPTPQGVENTLTPIEKAYSGSDKSPILDDFRKIGLEEGSSQIRAKILKGDYYMPDETEVSRW